MGVTEADDGADKTQQTRGLDRCDPALKSSRLSNPPTIQQCQPRNDEYRN
jgi:hypothetical protein